jgi:Tol biopolymer transport system component
VGAFAISPDGRTLAFPATGPDGIKRLWLRALKSLEAWPLSGTELGGGVLQTLFWSPDSRSIGFETDGKLKRIDVAGGPPQTICNLSTRTAGASWSGNGIIVLGTLTGLMRVPAAGGTPLPLTRTNPAKQETIHGRPIFLPDGHRLLYLIASAAPEVRGIYLRSLDSKVDEQKSSQILADTTLSAYVPSQNSSRGLLLFIREQTLLAQPFDEKRLELVGEPLPVAEQMPTQYLRAACSASANGHLVLRPSVYSRIAWFDRSGRELSRIGEPGEYPTFDLFKDSQLVVSKIQTTGPNLWVMDLLRGSTTRLTQENVNHVDPRWSPDGRQVIFGSTRDPSRSPSQVSLQDSDPVQVFKFAGRAFSLDDWSPDGRHLIYHDAGQPELWAIPLNGDRKPMLVTRSLSGIIDQAQFSPDSRWIAYNTNESGRHDVKVVPFPPTGEKWQISTAGGVQPTWCADGRELYFLAPDATLMAVDIRPGGKFEWREPHPLFKTQLAVSYQMEQYAPAPDGKRFLFVLPASEASTAPFNVILNWPALLKK